MSNSLIYTGLPSMVISDSHNIQNAGDTHEIGTKDQKLKKWFREHQRQ